MKLTPRHRTVISAAILVAGILAVGIANYFLAGLDSAVVPSTTLAPTKLWGVRSDPRVLLHLDWGDGSSGTTDDSVEWIFASAGRIFVVDHTTPGGGLRVRWFDGAGDEVGEHLPRIGATGFSASPDGFSYVISQGIAGDAETAALFDCDESVLTTYSVPLGLKAANVLQVGDTLYAQVDDSTYDPTTLEVNVVSKCVPVARDGIQATDDVAAQGMIDGFGVGLDGEVYGRTITGKATAGSRPSVTYRSVETSAALVVSEWSQYIGVDGEGRAFFLFRPEDAPQRQQIVGITTPAEQYRLVLIGSISGGPQWVLPVEQPRRLQMGRSLVSLSPDGLVLTRADASGVDVVLYEGDFR